MAVGHLVGLPGRRVFNCSSSGSRPDPGRGTGPDLGNASILKSTTMPSKRQKFLVNVVNKQERQETQELKEKDLEKEDEIRATAAKVVAG